MKIQYIILAIFISHFCNIYADDAPVYSLPGGNVMPIHNEDIRLVSETIDFWLYERDKGYDVEVNYNFYNEGKTQEIELGFPTQQEESDSYDNFITIVNGEKVKVERKAGLWTLNENFQKKYHEFNSSFPHLTYDYEQNGGDAFDVFKATFKSGDTTKIKNTYHDKYECTQGCESLLFWYILETGKYWKGKIDEVTVRIHTELYPEGQNYTASTLGFKDYVKIYKDIEPDFNLVYKIPTGFPMPTASSTLKPSKSINYNIDNIVDKNPTTAWIEGEDGYGEGSTINFELTYYEGNSYYEALSNIKAIHIINGYAKNATTFKNNSRVKDIEIELCEDVLKNKLDPSKYFEIGEEDEFRNEYIIARRKYYFTLEDTMEPQVLKFDFPKEIFDMKITIKSVYPGAKYKDTAISEIWLE